MRLLYAVECDWAAKVLADLLAKASHYIFIQLVPQFMMRLCSCSRRSEPFQKPSYEKSAGFPFTNVFYSLIILRGGVVKDKDCVRYVFIHVCIDRHAALLVYACKMLFYSNRLSLPLLYPAKRLYVNYSYWLYCILPFFPPLNCDRRL